MQYSSICNHQAEYEIPGTYSSSNQKSVPIDQYLPISSSPQPDKHQSTPFLWVWII